VDFDIRILVVDDFSTMRRIIKKILKDIGFNNIVEADDGSTAIDILKSEKIDFIISDWIMPNTTGLELLRYVRNSEKYPDIPFLMVTAEAQKEKVIDAVKAKVSHYIVKPFTADTLKEKIDKMFG